MARVYASLVTPLEVALAASTAKTVLMLTAGTNHQLVLTRLGIFFDGTKSNNEPVVIQLYRKTDAGTLTAQTPKLYQPSSETIQATGGYNATAEPSNGDLLDVWNIHPQQGIEIILPLMQECIVPGGGRIAMVVTAPDVVNCLAKLLFEE